MFYGAKAFNAPIYHWENTSSIRETGSMFKGASKFNQEVRTWDMTTVLNNGLNQEMFTNATAFQQKYTSIDTPQLDFWRLFQEYTVPANELTWSDVDITYTPNPVYQNL